MRYKKIKVGDVFLDNFLSGETKMQTKKILSFLFLLNFIFILLCNLLILQFRISVDGYNKLLYNNNQAFYLKDARVLSAALQMLIKWWPAVKFQGVYFFVFILFLCLCINIFMSIYLNFVEIGSIKKLLFVNWAFVFGFINILTQEYSLFPEDYFAYGTGLFLICMSIKSFFSDSNFKNRFGFMIIYLFLGLECYQIFIQAWLIFLAVFLLLKHKNCLSKEFFKDVLCIAVVFIFTLTILVCVIQVMIKLGLVDKARNIIILPKKNLFNIRSIFNCIKMFFRRPIKTIVGIMVYTLMSVFLCEIIFLGIKFSRKEIKSMEFFLPFILFIFAVLATFGIQVFMFFVWLPPRVLTGLGFLLCILLIYWSNFLHEKHLNYFICFVGILFFINVYFSQSIAINQYATNRIDQEQVSNICYRIKDYEEKNKIRVKKISFCQDTEPLLGYYGNTKYIAWDLNIREFMVTWGQIEIINYYSKRHFEKIDMPEEIYKKYFAKKQWDYYKPEEQLVFIGDTLHICVY